MILLFIFYLGEPCLFYILPNLPIGGVLQSNASHGTTGIFINERELHISDVANWNSIIGHVSKLFSK